MSNQAIQANIDNRSHFDDWSPAMPISVWFYGRETEIGEFQFRYDCRSKDVQWRAILISRFALDLDWEGDIPCSETDFPSVRAAAEKYIGEEMIIPDV
jgi:hypothetical protein